MYSAGGRAASQTGIGRRASSHGLPFSEARRALLDQPWDVVVVGALFDESRALDLMQLMRFHAAFPKVPIVGIRGAKIARIMKPEVFDLPMKQLGAVDVIDFSAIPGDAVGNAEIGVRIRVAARPFAAEFRLLAMSARWAS